MITQNAEFQNLYFFKSSVLYRHCKVLKKNSDLYDNHVHVFEQQSDQPN